MTERTLTLVAVQLRVSILCVERPRAFRRWIEEAAARAADVSGADSFDRLFVFPEDVGTWLLRVLAADAAGRHPLALLRGMVEARSVRPRRARVYAFASTVDKLMREVFGGVARRHRATVVAGTHLRPCGDGRLSHSSYAFDPRGRLSAITDQVNVESGDVRVSRGDPDRLPIVTTGWGTLATLIGYDACAAPRTASERFANMGRRVTADVIANPTAGCHNGGLLDSGPGGTEHGRVGVIAQLCGVIFEQTFEGRSQIVQRDAAGRARVLARATNDSESEIVSARIPLPFD